MVKTPRFETSSLETGIKTMVTETGQQLPPSTVGFFAMQKSCVSDLASLRHQHSKLGGNCCPVLVTRV